MTSAHTKKTALRFYLMATFLFACNCFAAAQTTASSTSKTDEQTIRDLVAQENEGKQVIQYTDDRIFVSGAYPRPMIGKEMSAENQQASNKLKAERRNFKGTSRIERIVVSGGGDMAYEFGYGNLSYDTPENNTSALKIHTCGCGASCKANGKQK
jgi:ketosteroid isomerase-like protein